MWLRLHPWCWRGSRLGESVIVREKNPLVVVGLDVTLTIKPLLPLAVYETARRLDSKFACLAARIFDFILRRCAQFGFDPPNGLRLWQWGGAWTPCLSGILRWV